MTVHVFGIPNCSTVKKSVAWFASQGIETVFVNYRTTPPNRSPRSKLGSSISWRSFLGSPPSGSCPQWPLFSLLSQTFFSLLYFAFVLITIKSLRSNVG